ncbi:MAG TPA: GlsB/YeaQ/YmgE family stress response membrane protein [Longimicrobiaceae bacterium]|nr:GlsB/YeaQ/YmgE family stress response membrane protein [Longimicrobiaceae bacterium]
MGILWWIIIGGIAGAIAKLLMPGKDPGGCIVTILLGIAGAIVGGWILGLILPGRDMGPTGFIGAIVGAVILLFIYRLIVGRGDRE